jgi:hypothetical protein
MDNTIEQWEQFARGALHLAGHTDEQIEAMRVKAVEKAQQEAAEKAKVYRVPTNDELRQQQEKNVRESLDRHHPGHDCTEEEIKAHVAVTHSDEAIAENKRQWHAQKRAEQSRYAEQLALEENAKKAAAKVKRAHEDRLDREKAATAAAEEDAERYKKQRDGYEAQVIGLLKGHRT